MPRAGSTLKSAETRERILGAASRLFVRDGFRQATMRRIAEEAGVALGLTYRYFPAKEDLALALYGQLAVELVTRTEAWGSLPLGEGFRRAMQEKLRLAQPHRDALSALFAASLGGEPEAREASVVSERSAAVRTQVRWVFQRVVERATDLPASLDEQARADLVTLLYGAHLLVLLLWLVDRSGGATSDALVDAAAAAIGRATPFAASPVLAPSWRGAAGWIARFLGDRPPASQGRSS
jgi:AcrR family transcriptional regulator